MKAAVRTEADKGKKKKERKKTSLPGIEITYFKLGALLQDSSRIEEEIHRHACTHTHIYTHTTCQILPDDVVEAG